MWHEIFMEVKFCGLLIFVSWEQTLPLSTNLHRRLWLLETCLQQQEM